MSNVCKRPEAGGDCLVPASSRDPTVREARFSYRLSSTSPLLSLGRCARTLLLIVYESELSVLELIHAMGMVQATVSRHWDTHFAAALSSPNGERPGHSRLNSGVLVRIQEVFQKTPHSILEWLSRLAGMGNWLPSLAPSSWPA